MQIGVDRRPVEGPVGREERRVGDEPESLLDLHRPEPVPVDADNREAIDLEGTARQREHAAAVIQIRRDRDPLGRAPAGRELPGLAVGLGLDGAEGGARGEPGRRVVDVVARLAQQERHMQAVAPLHAQHRAVGELQAAEMADGRGHPERVRVAADHAEDVLEHGLFDDLLGPMQRDVAGIARDGRDAEHRDPPQRRESPRAPRPERPARHRDSVSVTYCYLSSQPSSQSHLWPLWAAASRHSPSSSSEINQKPVTRVTSPCDSHHDRAGPGL